MRGQHARSNWKPEWLSGLVARGCIEDRPQHPLCNNVLSQAITHEIEPYIPNRVQRWFSPEALGGLLGQTLALLRARRQVFKDFLQQ